MTQMGVWPLQSALVAHCTHMFKPTSHDGVPPVHWVLLVLVHFWQEPSLLQAGALAALRALHSPSPVGEGFTVQARQVNVF